MVQCKLYGFIKNSKAESNVASTVLRAREIQDEHVSIDKFGEVAYIASQTNFPSIWCITSLGTDWTHCTCPLGMRGNICKHVVKVYKMMNWHVQDAIIICYVGFFCGTITIRAHHIELTIVLDTKVGPDTRVDPEANT